MMSKQEALAREDDALEWLARFCSVGNTIEILFNKLNMLQDETGVQKRASKTVAKDLWYVNKCIQMTRV